MSEPSGPNPRPAPVGLRDVTAVLPGQTIEIDMPHLLIGQTMVVDFDDGTAVKVTRLDASQYVVEPGDSQSQED